MENYDKNTKKLIQSQSKKKKPLACKSLEILEKSKKKVEKQQVEQK